MIQPSKFKARNWVEINDELRGDIIMIMVIIMMMIIIMLNLKHQW